MHSYPSIFNLGHKAVALLFNEPVLVQEKVDGSQISFCMFVDLDGVKTLRVRSKGAELQILAPDKMFRAGVEAIKAVEHLLVPGWTYRGEYLARPKHNVLAYDRIPENHIAIFDIDRGNQDYLDPHQVLLEAHRLDFERVPSLAYGYIEDAAQLRELLDTPSFLGGQKIEGVVVKNYARFGLDKKVLMGKFVSEAFKEVHAAAWKKENPSSGDIVDNLIAQYRSPARWAKAVQHLREAGRLEDSPRDIGELFKEVPIDIRRECEDAIKDALFAHVWPKLQRGVTAGMADWYKQQLLERQFETTLEHAGEAS